MHGELGDKIGVCPCVAVYDNMDNTEIWDDGFPKQLSISLALIVRTYFNFCENHNENNN